MGMFDFDMGIGSRHVVTWWLKEMEIFCMGCACIDLIYDICIMYIYVCIIYIYMYHIYICIIRIYIYIIYICNRNMYIYMCMYIYICVFTIWYYHSVSYFQQEWAMLKPIFSYIFGRWSHRSVRPVSVGFASFRDSDISAWAKSCACTWGSTSDPLRSQED